jgi:hypothetical protein
MLKRRLYHGNFTEAALTGIMGSIRLYCQTCCKEVGAAHRAPEPQWLHRTILWLDQEKERFKFQKEEPQMPKAKTTSKGKVPMKKAPMKSPARGAKAPVGESAAERRLRLAEEEKSKRARK